MKWSYLGCFGIFALSACTTTEKPHSVVTQNMVLPSVPLASCTDPVLTELKVMEESFLRSSTPDCSRILNSFKKIEEHSRQEPEFSSLFKFMISYCKSQSSGHEESNTKQLSILMIDIMLQKYSSFLINKSYLLKLKADLQKELGQVKGSFETSLKSVQLTTRQNELELANITSLLSLLSETKKKQTYVLGTNLNKPQELIRTASEIQQKMFEEIDHDVLSTYKIYYKFVEKILAEIFADREFEVKRTFFRKEEEKALQKLEAMTLEFPRKDYLIRIEWLKQNPRSLNDTSIVQEESSIRARAQALYDEGRVFEAFDLLKSNRNLSPEVENFYAKLSKQWIKDQRLEVTNLVNQTQAEGMSLEEKIAILKECEQRIQKILDRFEDDPSRTSLEANLKNIRQQITFLEESRGKSS